MTLADPTSALDVEAFCTGAAFTEVAPAWDELWVAATPRSPFLSAAWHAAWWRSVPEGRPELLVARRAGAMAALAPFVRTGDTLVFSGGELTDLQDILSGGDDAVRAVARAAAGRAARLDLRYVRERSSTLGPFADELRASGMRVTVEPLVVSPRIALATSFEEYVSGLSKKDRHELRRKLRRLESEGEVTFAFARAESLPPALDRFVAWHRAQPGEKGTFLTPDHEAFFREIARAGVSGGWLRLGELAVNGRPVASLFAFELDEVLSAYNSAVDPEASPLSPGVLLHACAIRDAISRGITTYDLLRGDERYKYDLGARDMPLYRLVAERDA